MTGGLTPAQAKLLAFLTAYADEHDFSPSVEEMRAGCGLASASGVIRLLDGLEERGNDPAPVAYRIARAALLIVRGVKGGQEAAGMAYRLADELATTEGGG